MNKIPGCYTPIPMGAFYTVVKLPVDDADKFCEWCLESFDYEGQTVFMAPPRAFIQLKAWGAMKSAWPTCFGKEELAKAIKVLEEALKAYPGRTI